MPCTAEILDMSRALLFLFCLAPMTFGASVAFAQDAKPYTPHEYSRSELIDFGTYDRLPLVFEFDAIDVAEQHQGGRINFAVTLDADYPTVLEHFKDAYTSQATVARLAPGMVPLSSTRELKVIGHTFVDEQGKANFTLRGKNMTRSFTVEVSEEAGQARLTMQNIVISQLFSGVMPARSPFKPASAKPVRLLWN